MANQIVFTTVDGHAWWARPFSARAPAPRFITARVLGVTRTERALVSTYAASTIAAPAYPTRSMTSMPRSCPPSSAERSNTY